MADEHVELNQNLEKELHKFPAVTAGSRAVAVAIADRAREMAPVQSGAYQAGIIVDPPNSKGVARVHSTDNKSSWIEFGTSTQPGQFVIRNAVESLGYKFKTRGN